jgi:threonine/homoserine/homoserine lactone efflux protein
MWFFIGKGIIVGFAIAAPVGPIGILCIHRSLHQGYKWGFVTGVGAATADAIYGAIAGFGLTFISGFLLQYQHWIHLVGGCLLLYFGSQILFSKASMGNSVQTDNESNLFLTYAGALFLNLTNPMTILLFLSIFSGMGLLSSSISYEQTAALILGMLLGALSWWIILCGSTRFLLRRHLNNAALLWVQRITGIAILLFAIVLLVS